MYYVVLEVEITHLIETPKDQCKIAKLSYQFVNSDTLQTYYEEDEVPLMVLNEIGSPTFQEAMMKLDEDIAKVTGDAPFVLCSLNSTWHLRVTLSRQARDCGFVLRPHFQQPKIFDLWKEYERWCVNHPEVIPLRKNGGIGGKRVKDVAELARVLDIPGANLTDWFDLARSVEVVLQLQKKCSTPEDMAMVLTHPYDSHVDTRNFLQEYSKVLYLNNLPPDTTQSELESWFTQFGARPVGFWTVKNIVEETSNVNNNWSMNNSPYVEEQDSISGFVVFQTHEEAAEVLILNGRSILSNMANTKQPRVVEHIVEIQPSSTRVLDRAQEILSPFPQSKNKPRPGDWNCPSCGFSNFQRRTACFRCSFPATTAVQVNTKQYISGSGGANLQGGKITPSPSQGYYPLNVPQGQDMPAQHGRGMDPGIVMMRYQNGGNGMVFSQNGSTSGGAGGGNRYNGPRGSSNIGNGGSNVPFRAGDWKCPACTYHNFAKNVVCLRCGGPKVSPVDFENVNGGSSTPNTKNSSVSLMDLTSMGSTLSLGDKLSNGIATATHEGFGVALDSRSASEPKW